MTNYIEKLFGFACCIFLLFHASALFYAAGPFNLYPDSGGYLQAATSYLTECHILFSQARPIGLPFLYFALLKISNGNLYLISMFQLFFFYVAVYSASWLSFPDRSWITRLVVTLGIVLLSFRTFVYSYMVLSEIIFAAFLVIFAAVLINCVRAQQAAKYKRLYALFLCAVALSLIKSSGWMFLVIVLAIYCWHYFKGERRPRVFLPVLVILPLILAMNYIALGTLKFSQQDAIQLLISANQYINYDTDYMAADKAKIKKSHEEILERYYPRTRLDQMIGPVEGIKTPSQILRENYKTNDEYNEKIKALIFEGLMSGGNSFRYAWSGVTELYKMIVKDVEEGTIIPLISVGDYNNDVLRHTPSLKKNERPQREIENSVSGRYYKAMAKYFFWPKYISFAAVLIALGYSMLQPTSLGGKGVSRICAFIFLICVMYLYASCLLVFALDRYYVGVESVMWLLFFVLLNKLTAPRLDERIQHRRGAS